MPELADVRLRPMEPADRDRLLDWRNSERVRANMFTDHVIGADEHAKWFARSLAESTTAHFIFEIRGRPLGFSSLTAIARAHRRCSWGFYLAEADLPRGTGSAMTFLTLCHAFESIGVDKVCCEVFSFNARALRMLENAGFAREGRLARHCVKNGKQEDVVCLARFRDNWDRDKPALRARRFGAAESAQ